MVKISELTNDASVNGTEQVPLNDGWTTKKATINDILAKQHNHTASDVTDFNTAVDARVNVPTDTEKTTPVDTDVFALWDTIRKKVTWANIKATLKTYFDTLYHTKNALRTWLTASKMLITDGSGNEWYQDIPAWVVKLAWENITQWNTLRLANIAPWETINVTLWTLQNKYMQYTTTLQSAGQSFVINNAGLLVSNQINILKVGAPTWNLTMEIYTDTNLVTPVATSTNTVSVAWLTTSYTANTFNFSNVYLPIWTYRWKVSSSGSVSTVNYVRIGDRASNVYASWTLFDISSTNVRTADSGNDFWFVLTLNTNWETTWRVYKTDADFTHMVNCIWFANNTATTWNNVTVDQTYNNKQTWLTINTTYYLSNTPWAISTTAWTVSKIVWRSISTTELLINLFW